MAIDDRITAPSFGFGDAANYYRTQSAIGYLDAIRVPTLLIQAKDDPLVPFAVFEKLPANPCIELAATGHGGHLGFLGKRPHRFWADQAVMEWIQAQLSSQAAKTWSMQSLYHGLHMKNPVFCSIVALLACGGLQAQDAKAMLTYAQEQLHADQDQSDQGGRQDVGSGLQLQGDSGRFALSAPLIAHIADAQMRFCGTANGHQVQPPAGSKTAKADLVAALKTSFDECDAAFDKLSEANYLEAGGQGKGAGPRLNQLLHTVIHDNEEYGYLSVYMRLKGMVPPSSDRAM